MVLENVNASFNRMQDVVQDTLMCLEIAVEFHHFGSKCFVPRGAKNAGCISEVHWHVRNKGEKSVVSVNGVEFDPEPG